MSFKRWALLPGTKCHVAGAESNHFEVTFCVRSNRQFLVARKAIEPRAEKSLQAKNRVFRTIERFWLQSERGALIINAPQTADTSFTVTAER
jgi:hypothetical protein